MLHRFEIPESFLRRHRPVVTHGQEIGVKRFLFDCFGLAFYRSMAITPIASDLIWSVTAGDEGASYHLHPGERDDSVGFVLTQRHTADDSGMPIALARRLTHREKLCRCLLRSLLAELSSGTFQTPAEVIEFIAARANTES